MVMNHADNQSSTVWQNLSASWQQPAELCRLSAMGVGIGLAVGIVISLFRIAKDFSYNHLISWLAAQPPLSQNVIWIIAINLMAIIVILLMRNPAIRSGGAAWVTEAIKDGQPSVWRKILIPKFIGSYIVLACGVSVGCEGPCIQMGAATALGLKNFNQGQYLERRYFILAGSACGLAAAFSAPFAGICYVYEVMKEKIDAPLLFFLIASSFGVYLGCTQIFGLDILLPLGTAPMPPLCQLWIILPVGIAAGLIGIVYNYTLRGFIHAYHSQKIIPWQYWPIFVFGATALAVIFFPAISGEGLTIFKPIQAGELILSNLLFFLLAKLLFTAFCYGSGVPAGIMVPLLCVGGVTGAICGDILQALGLMGPEYAASCIVMGMAAAFASGERAPLTALVLVAQMTGSFATALGLLAVSGIAAFMAKLARVKIV